MWLGNLGNGNREGGRKEEHQVAGQLFSPWSFISTQERGERQRRTRLKVKENEKEIKNQVTKEGKRKEERWEGGARIMF